MKTNVREKFNPLLSYLALVALAFLAALNYEIFVHPNRFAPAGINGIATMVQYLLDFSIGYMSLLINIPMLIAASFLLNRAYAFRTLTYVLVFAGSLLVLQRIDISAIQFVAGDNGSAIMASVAAGFFNGFFYSLSIRMGGSTGGTDIVGSFVHAKAPQYNMVWVVFSINVTVAVSSFFVYGLRYEPVILCIIYCFVTSRVSDMIFKGARSAVRFEVVTAHPDELARELMTTLRHGCTLMRAEGMYSHSEQAVLICVVNRRQTVDFQNILKKYDHTFACVSDVNEIFGNFKKIK